MRKSARIKMWQKTYDLLTDPEERKKSQRKTRNENRVKMIRADVGL